MRAVIQLDVPDWQIGQEVTVYFPDTMMKHGKCELLKEPEAVVRCRDCKYYSGQFCNKNDVYPWPKDDWFCADGERRTDDG